MFRVPNPYGLVQWIVWQLRIAYKADPSPGIEPWSTKSHSFLPSYSSCCFSISDFVLAFSLSTRLGFVFCGVVHWLHSFFAGKRSIGWIGALKTHEWSMLSFNPRRRIEPPIPVCDNTFSLVSGLRLVFCRFAACSLLESDRLDELVHGNPISVSRVTQVCVFLSFAKLWNYEYSNGCNDGDSDPDYMPNWVAP